MKKSILSILIFCELLSSTCINNGDKTVTCSESKLMWVDRQDHRSIGTWTEVLEYCEKLNLAGYSDWRLPNINELLSIADFRENIFSINSAFKNSKSKHYWSSTTFKEYRDYDKAWSLGFEGRISVTRKVVDSHALCVRDIP